MRPYQNKPFQQDKMETLNSLWCDYLQGGYFDSHGNLKVEYVSRERVEPLVKAMCRDPIPLTSHQVRRYFGHCRTIETRLKCRESWSWENLFPKVKTLDVAAADGFAKKPPKIPKLFHDFIQRNVQVIKGKEDFLCGFLPHFEALIGFGARYFNNERR